MMLLLAADSNRGGLRCAACARGKHVPRGSPYSHASSIHPGFVEISLACIHTYPHRCCCTACIRLGNLFSRQRSFCFLCCDMYVRFRGCPVVLHMELYVIAWYQKTRRALYFCARGVLWCCCVWQPTARTAVCGVRHNFQNCMQYGAETKERFCANRNTRESRSIQNAPT